MTGALYKEEIWTQTHTWRIPGEGKGRDQGNSAEAKEFQGLPANYKELGDRQGMDSSS